MSQCISFYQIHRKIYSCNLLNENTNMYDYNMDDIHHVIDVLGTVHYIISYQAGNDYISQYTIDNCNCNYSDIDNCYNHNVKDNKFVTHEVMIDTTNLELCYLVTINIKPHVDNTKTNFSLIGKTIHGNHLVKI